MWLPFSECGQNLSCVDSWRLCRIFFVLLPLCHLLSKKSVLQAMQEFLKLSMIPFLTRIRLWLLSLGTWGFLFLLLPSLCWFKLLLLCPTMWLFSLLFHLSRLPELPLNLVELDILGFSSPSIFFKVVNFGFLHVLLWPKLAFFATQANLPIDARYSDNPTPILKRWHR